ncbi:DUF4179 domain-containing protein [Clostridium sp. AL.422]|uniref:DUF4179 domain-containing protein n=1 Tax=Clostridium TaxID=1485 RepID=UPI00293DEB63|nr:MULTISPECIES: DUF4179 domain-containing protein [unclassified Clostridium]MDV4152361.1 DUF4179 domain-containing protein [Clostridium sp. AL.422]
MKMSDDSLDKKIKEKLSKEISYIPQDIDQVFDNTISKLKVNRRLKFKNVAGICVALLTIFIVFGSSLTTYASNIPIISSILEMFKSNRYENYDKYSSDLNITKESNGIQTTITKVVYDGIELYIFYMIQSEEPMEDIPYFLVKEIKIDNNITTFGYGGEGRFLDNNKTYSGVISYDVGIKSIVPKEEQEQNLYGGYVEIPDEFLLSIKVNKIGDIKESKVIDGEWIFDIPVSNEKLKGMVKEYNLNQSLDNIYEGSKVNKLILTPINTILQGYMTEDCDLYFTIIDDKGRFILPKGGSMSGAVDNEGNNVFYFNSNFKELFEDTKSLTFIPYERNYYKLASDIISSNNNIKEDYKMSSKLNLSGETILKSKVGDDYITITRIETRNEKTRVYFKSDYGLLAAPKKIIDKTTNKEIFTTDNFDSGDINTSRYLRETGEFMIEFDGELASEDNEIEYYDISERITEYSDDAFTIKLNK